MFKVRRGDAPASVPSVEFAAPGNPINASVSQGGFEQGNHASGNLRDHNGKVANEGAIKATKHYDGDYGIASAMGALVGGNSQSVGTKAPVPTPGGGRARSAKR